MKGVILAGGTGSRLAPLTQVTNKHLLPVGKYPMIYHVLNRLISARIEDILIVSGRQHMGAITHLLGNGDAFGARLTYKVQEQAGGIAQALGLAEAFVGDDSFAVILGDNVFEMDLSPFVAEFEGQQGAQVFLSEVSDPQRFGVPELVGDRVVQIEEKPTHPKSSYAVTGIYFYDPHVFQMIRGLKPSDRGELEITDVNNAYIAKGQLTYRILEGWWTDAGTPESYFRANELAQSIHYDLKDHS